MAPDVSGGQWDWNRLRALALRETRRVLDPDSAQDAAQEAIVRAWRRAHTCAGSDPEPWIKTIARREALRIAARRSDEEIPVAGILCLAEDEDVLQAEQRLDVARALCQCSRAEREVLFLHYWADLTFPQIAALLRIPLGTVKVRTHRAQIKLGLELIVPDKTQTLRRQRPSRAAT